jgi:hypothetical protein
MWRSYLSAYQLPSISTQTIKQILQYSGRETFVKIEGESLILVKVGIWDATCIRPPMSM